MNPLASSIRWVLKGNSGSAATVQTLLTRFTIIAINMGTSIITARVLGTEGRGEQAAISLWPQFMAYAMTLGLPSALLFNIRSYPKEKSKLFPAALLLGTALGILATITGIVFVPYWLTQYSPEVIRNARWLMLNSTFALLWLVCTAALEAYGDFTTANKMRYLPHFCALILVVMLAWTHSLTPLTAVMAYLLPGILILLWMLRYFWRLFQPRWRGLNASYRKLLNYGLRSYGNDLLQTLAGQLNQALLIGLLSPAFMGIYVVNFNLCRMLDVFHSGIVVVLLPKASALPIAEVVALVGRAVRVSIAVTILAGIFLMLCGPELLRILYGSEFIRSVNLFRILVVEVIVSGAILILVQAFMALGRPETVTIFQAIGVGLSVALLLLLVPAYGLVGVGLALLGSSTVRLMLVLLSYPLILKVRLPNLIITWEDLDFMKQKILKKT